MGENRMQVRSSTSPEQIPGFDTQDLRDRYLVSDLFAGGVRAVYTHEDRVVLAGIVPQGDTVTLETFDELRTPHFFTGREGGVVNVGGPGVVEVDGERFEMDHGACLYIGRGSQAVTFADGEGEEAPSCFYLFSAPAHAEYPTTLRRPGEGTVRELGDPLTSNRRTLEQFIHADGVASCQVVMGVTTLHPGSMWNTMPAHTHDRRTECYLYFDLPEDARVVHLLGEPTQTRHMVVADREAVIAPSWSVHSGVATASYAFVWAMAGENKAFDDMDGFAIGDMR